MKYQKFKAGFLLFFILTLSLSGCLEDGGDNEKNGDEKVPFYVSIYYHVEPNKQLFNYIQPGNFEAVSISIRQMSEKLAHVNASATFCFSWLYNDIVLTRNLDPKTGKMFNSDRDTGIETFTQVKNDGHEVAYHTHPPNSLRINDTSYYVRPKEDGSGYEKDAMHSWYGAGADAEYKFEPGIYKFNDTSDPWFGKFTWEHTTESLLKIGEYLDLEIRHINGGQRPLFDLQNNYGSGINHDYSFAQIDSLNKLGFDLISPECLALYSPDHKGNSLWFDQKSGYASYFGEDENVQVYYPDITNKRLDMAVEKSSGVTFLPVSFPGHVSWNVKCGSKDDKYYVPEPLGTGGGGVRWDEETFYEEYSTNYVDPYSDTNPKVVYPSLADQFNYAMNRHEQETPTAINAWGFNHHVVNVMWADLTGLSDNFDWEIKFIQDIADGKADNKIGEPDLNKVQFVTMQELAKAYEHNDDKYVGQQDKENNIQWIMILSLMILFGVSLWLFFDKYSFEIKKLIFTSN